MPNKSVQPGQYEIRELSITCHTGKVYDLSDMFVEFDIYEDIFEIGTKATIVIADGLNLISNVPIVGGEKIILRFKSMGMEYIRTHEFVVGDISARVISEKFQTYKLNLLTPELYKSLGFMISKAYSGFYTDVMKAVITGDLGSSKKIELGQYATQGKFISPNWTIGKLINWIQSHTYDTFGSPYIFYEGVEGYVFKSIKDLYEQESYGTYFYEPKNQIQTEKKNPLYNIQDFQWADSNNRSKYNRTGAMGRTEQTFDMTNKKYTTQFVPYDSIPNKISKNFLFDDKNIQKEVKHFNFSDTEDEPSYEYYRSATFNLLGNTIMRWNLFGDPAFTVGMVVGYDAPSLEPQRNNSTSVKKEKYISGKYLVTSVRHIITKGEYTMTIEVAKDSYSNEIFQKDRS